MRRLIDTGPNSSSAGREKAWVEKELAVLDELEPKNPIQRYAAYSQMARDKVNPALIARRKELMELPPGERAAALSQEFKDKELQGVTNIFKDQFTRLIQSNQRRFEEAIKGN